eukprot:CAMPEP_0174250266 /NCGR_PEP_ID=MMETSP0439-20130205/492_1 /TAXON_ID=0 /ORGANISM="Stereomyxa ramosa, Strain Chinc5" /LENGTH=69 /DNA_ID=CAMNT_0015330285 /DNA_START=178 /DNA_END=387 /DNA_ORIENTATION=+
MGIFWSRSSKKNAEIDFVIGDPDYNSFQKVTNANEMTKAGKQYGVEIDAASLISAAGGAGPTSEDSDSD